MGDLEMGDLEIERELRRALAATPSPEFVARVRTSIVEAPRPSIFAGVLRPTLAIACMAVLTVAVGIWRQDARLKPSPTEPVNAERPAETVVTSLTSGPAAATGVNVSTTPETDVIKGPRATDVEPEVAAPARVALAKTDTSSKEEPLPEVIIAPEDAEAVRQFLRSAYDRRFVASFEDPRAPDPWVLNDLTVPPLAVAPLDPAPAYNN